MTDVKENYLIKNISVFYGDRDIDADTLKPVRKTNRNRKWAFKKIRR